MGNLNFTTYSENGNKYIAIYETDENKTIWSRHFKVEATADDRGIKNDGFDENRLFRPLQEV